MESKCLMTNHVQLFLNLFILFLTRTFFFSGDHFVFFHLAPPAFEIKPFINKAFGRRKKEDGLSQAESLMLISVSLMLTKISKKRQRTFLFCVLSRSNIFNPIKLLYCHNSTVISHVFPLFTNYKLLPVCTRRWSSLG